jgi:hypothetical protein
VNRKKGHGRNHKVRRNNNNKLKDNIKNDRLSVNVGEGKK